VSRLQYQHRGNEDDIDFLRYQCHLEHFGRGNNVPNLPVFKMFQQIPVSEMITREQEGSDICVSVPCDVIANNILVLSKDMEYKQSSLWIVLVKFKPN
jgi:hypothetical protein